MFRCLSFLLYTLLKLLPKSTNPAESDSDSSSSDSESESNVKIETGCEFQHDNNDGDENLVNAPNATSASYLST
jgi:hypothetical protein